MAVPYGAHASSPGRRPLGGVICGTRGVPWAEDAGSGAVASGGRGPASRLVCSLLDVAAMMPGSAQARRAEARRCSSEAVRARARSPMKTPPFETNFASQVALLPAHRSLGRRSARPTPRLHSRALRSRLRLANPHAFVFPRRFRCPRRRRKAVLRQGLCAVLEPLRPQSPWERQ